MIPKSLSATALQTANLCLARYEAEHIHRGRAPGKSAATLGSAVHGALEMYVKAVYLEKKQEPSLTLLFDLYKMSFMTEFGTSECSGEEFDDGQLMVKGWYERTDFSNLTVLSAEVKENFPVPTSIGDIPYNYIWDRFDQTGEREVTVVDYKTNRWAISPEQLGSKVQARCYALAAAIKAKKEGLEVDRVWVVFDLLRHTPVGRVFTREENVATWRFIKSEAERIIATPDGEAPETLNNECLFCVRITQCNAVAANIAAGGILGLDLAAAIDRRAMLNSQKKAIAKALEALDTFIETEARAKDVIEFETDLNKLTFKVSARRAVDGERVQHVIGPDLFTKYGGLAITMGQFDKLVKDPNLTEDQRAQLKQLVYKNYGEPSVETTAKNAIDDD